MRGVSQASAGLFCSAAVGHFTRISEVGSLAMLSGFSAWCQAPSLVLYLDGQWGRFPVLPKNSQETSSPKSH
ncbi:protein of unknown function [Pseudomonas putida KT2440]|uniref:Uncharacterized protein n=1 Tax=Pseudomonas putida (strain ATCC 47054 / DSM 6125 / CFBP 8728 / NCIMB 11950 / KT2440) TaxID=160488 RepID=A0A140FWQ7_PSEPK|nr:protein of unknown function [Pseudomonas putida KT2440]